MLMSRPEFSIRPLLAADAGGMGEVEVQVWQTCYRDILPAAFLAALSAERQAGQWRGLLSGGDPLLGLALGSADGRLAGFLVASAPRDLPPGAARSYRSEILALNILPEWQGRGYGRRLLAHAAGWLAARDMAPPYIWIFSDHARTRDFAESLGGRPIAGRIVSLGGERVARSAYGLPDLEKQARSTRRR